MTFSKAEREALIKSLSALEREEQTAREEALALRRKTHDVDDSVATLSRAAAALHRLLEPRGR